MNDHLALLPLWYAAFLLSLTVHEAAHALVAYKGGDPTAYIGGQVTLNPLPHVQREIFGTVVVPLLLFVTSGWMMGWASAPYDPYWEERYPKRAALMAAAGPLANLLLGTLAFVALKGGLAAAIWIPGSEGGLAEIVRAAPERAELWDGIGTFLGILLVLNLLLFLFNLIPVPPLDGASVLAGLFEPLRRLRDGMRASPMVALIGLLVAWTVFPRLFVPVYRVVLSWLA